MNRTPADDLADLLSKPQFWMNKAEALRASAGAVWYCQQAMPNSEFFESLGTKPAVNMSGKTWQVYRMLCGMSLELAYKASLVAIGREVKTTHNLVWLAEQVCFNLSPKEQGLLALLSEWVIWEGRYPCPKDEQSLEYFVYLHYGNLFRKVRTGNLTILEPVEPDPLGWEGYSELWKSAVVAYEWYRS
jgi:hypothetical protein